MKDLEDIRNKAIQAFWTSVTEDCPDIKTGDLSPMTVNAFDNFADALIEDWIEMNKTS